MKVGDVSDLEDKLIALQNELQKLTEVRNDVMRRVVVAEQHYMMKRKAQVQGWLSGVEAVEAEKLKNCLGGYCSKSCKSSYKFGKEVARKLQAVISLKGEGDFKDVAETVPEDPVDEMPLERTIVGQQATFQKVLNCLAENAIIGLYGSGGVGKTTLLKQINNNFCYGGHNFDIVIWVVVSKELKLERIQEDIGKKIRLPTDSWKNRSIENEARDIYNILRKKKFLLLLDDMWESIDLTKVGVPLSNQKTESKIVFTTRFEEVCGKMEAQKKIKVECLGLEEAWRLFQMKVGEDTLDKLPIGLKALVNLRYLNLERMYSLRTIPRHLISSFSMLQVLRMLNCGEFGGTLDKNFVFDDEFLIEELFGLKRLNELSITLRTPHALERFLSSLKLKSCTHSLRLRFHSEMKSLNISSLADMKHLHKFSVSCDGLEEFEIGFAGNVQRIREAHVFHALHKVYIQNCNALKDMTWLLFAPNLKILDILNCNKMEEIISAAKLGEVQEIPFNKLEFLELHHVPELKSIYWSALGFQQQKKIIVYGCPKLKRLPLDSTSAKERKIVVKGDENWWNELEWEDQATRNAFLLCFNSNRPLNSIDMGGD
ncbi:Disease resistance protein SUMM2 [Citrus sinensis]|uniref:Disease resistance protein SUMM2 n=1 Tax=Citrus sinensis TaxID=2711 RepID=A0ACB8JAW3_CITSI|nr:Disease resistance protein SUMM2 [Citrus sinensis]